MAQPAILAYKTAWEDIEEYDKVILITWNPNPRFYDYKKYDDNDYNMQWWTMLDKLTEAYRCCSRFAFMPEISDKGKLHMHGWFVVKDKIKFTRQFIRSLEKNGFVKQAKANSHKWKTFKYHIKDVKATSQYITDDEIRCITHENYQDYRTKYHLRKALLCHDPVKDNVRKMNVMKMLYGIGGFEESDS